ncbi:Ig-like domain-containing protein [Natronosalvus rutilus]|uniref:Ig-like domain-containing protein n=1 Tax=Natronosalvus rutilus TaxID=2953753 RepID=A0A9E7SX98_9EURY|nr:Ig-like domain-containing protein [Natronosalvus rutilus]UTF54821.1 Ig-like domain-containing protein [Natronosalvus rutilus]
MSRPHPKARRITALVLAVMTACAVFAIGGGVVAASSHDDCTSVSSATVINQSGCYVLDSDLTASGDPIVEINASDVVFDGLAHEIGGGDPAIHVMPGVSNVTVRNVTVYSSYAGIYVESASDVTVEDVTARNNDEGLFLEETTDVRIENVTTRNNDDGITLQYASNVAIRDVTHQYDTNWGLHAEDSVNVTVERLASELSNGEGFDDGAIYFDETNGSIVDSTLGVGEYGLGVELYYSHGTVIDNVTVSASEEHALDVDGSEDVVVRNSTFATGPDDDAVYVDNSPNARLTDVSVEGGEYGVALSGSANVTMRNVAMDNSTWGFSMSGHYRHDIDQSNTVDSLPVYIYEDVDGMTFDGSVPRGYLAVVDGSDITLSGFERTDTGQAFVAAHVQGLTVDSSRLTHNEYGLHVVNSTSVSVTDTNVSDSHYGMYLGDSPGATVDSLVALEETYWAGARQALRVSQSPDLTVTNGTFDRMQVWLTDSDRLRLENSYVEGSKVEFFGSEDVIIRDNEFVGGGTVVDVRDLSRRATIENNTIANPHSYGISLMENSNGAVIRNNEIQGVTQGTSYTGVGIQLVYTEAHITNNTINDVERAGIGLSGGTGAVVENNTVTNSPTGIETNINRNTREFVVRHNTIDGVTDGVVLTRYASDAVIDGNAIGNASRNGIEATGPSYLSTKSSNVTITANHVSLVGTNGAYLNNVEEYTVADNTFTNGTDARAIHVSASDTVAVTGNDVDGYGELTALRDQPRGAITVADATNVLVEANSLESSVVGIQILEAGGSVTVSDNAVTNATHVGIAVDAPETTISTNDVRWTAGPGIAVGSRTLPAQGEDEIVADNATVANNLVVENDLGIAVWDDDATVSENHVERNGAGIRVGSALGIDGITLVDNVIADNRNETATEVRASRGIVLDHLVGGTVANNTVTNSLAAIQFIATTDVVVEDNRFNESNQGLAFVQTLSHVDQTADGDPRYTWTPPSTNVTVSHNTLAGNGESVHFAIGPSTVVDDGASTNVTDPTFHEGDEHLIYNNVFNGTTAFNKTYAINESFLPGYERDVFPNVWNVSDTPGPNVIGGPALGGNYWASPDGSGYSQTCTDADGDGFCDAPYELEGSNNTDWLPLSSDGSDDGDGGDDTGDATGDVTVSPTSIDFETVLVGSTTTATVSVSNDGNASLSFGGTQLVGPSADAYAVTAGNGTTTIPADGSHDVTVEFGPTEAGLADASLVVSTDDPDEPTVTVGLSGNGTLVAPNRAPVAVADHYVVAADQNLTVNAPGVLANDLDPNGDSFSATHYGDPSNGTVTTLTGSGTFEYVPDPGFVGTDSFTYWIQDDHGESSSYATVTIDVVADPNRAPVAVSDHYTTFEGQNLTVSAPGLLENDYDVDADSIEATHYGDPSNGTVTTLTGSGTFEYVPDPDFVGTDSFTYWIQDDHGESSSYGTVTIEVAPDPNRAPVVVSDHYTTDKGQNLTVSAPGLLENDYDPDGDSVQTTHYGNPSNGTVTTLTGSGTFEYVPDPDFVGTDSFTYWIQDDHGESSSYGTVTVEVVEPNRPPVAVSDHYATLQDQNLTVSAPGLLGNDYDPDNDSVQTTHYGNPSNGTVTTLTGSGTFEYVPDPDFVGTDSFIYWTQDDHGESSSYATVTVDVVDPSGTAPVATDDHYTTYEGQNLSVSAPGVLANDLDPNGDSFSATHYGDPSNGTVTTLTGSGTFEYVPDPDFTGTDSFTYWIQDDHGESSSYGTVTIEVAPDPNRAPVAVSDHYTTFEGQNLTVSAPGLLENDYDVDADSIEATHYGNPSNGTVTTLTGSGTFEYVPDPDFVGTDSFTYWIQDDHGESSSYGTVTIEVAPDPNRAPVAVSDHYTAFEGQNLTVSAPGLLENDYDPDNDSVQTTHYGNPSNGTVTTLTGSGTFEYVPDPDFVGTDSFTYWIQDDHGESSSYATVTIEVAPDPNRAPVAVPDHYATLQGQNLTVSAPGLLGNDYDPDGDSIEATHYGNPSNGTVTTLTGSGTFEYVPDPGFAGTDSFTYWNQDADGESSSYTTVSIIVVEVDQPGRVAVDPGAVDFADTEVGSTASQTVTVTNIGGTPLTVSGVDLAGAGTPFDVVAGNATTQLATGETHTVTVSFEPTTVGGASDTLRIHTDDTTTPVLELGLSGTGVTSDDGAEGSDGGDTGAGAGSGSDDSSADSDDSSADSDDSSADSGGSDSPTGRTGSDVTVIRSADGTTDVSVENAQNGTAVDIDTSGTGSGNVTLDGLNITPLVDGDFTLNVSVSEDAPPGAPDTTPSGESPISYLNVDHSIPDEEIGEVTFRLRVSKDTLAARGLAPSDVVVYRYHDGQWQTASMRVVDETATHHVFEATVPGLSVFAVSGQAAVADDPTPPATDEPTGTDSPGGSDSSDEPTGTDSPDGSDSSDESVDGGLMDEEPTSDTPSSSPEHSEASPGVLIAAVVALSVGIGALWLYRRSHRGRP